MAGTAMCLARRRARALLVLALWLTAVAPCCVNPATAATYMRELQTLTNVGGASGLKGASGVAISPDGTNAYVASGTDNAVVVFSRNVATGALTFFESHFDGVAGVDGLLGAYDVTVSPDGKHVYVTGSAVAVFSRDAGTGALTFVEVKRQGVGGVDGLSVPRRLALSADGADLYVAGAGSNALAVFQRDAITGALTFVEAEKDGVGGVDGLALAIGVAVSPDGKHVYVTGGEGKVALFSRDAGTGAVTFVQALVVGQAETVVVSPDGAHVYIGTYDSPASIAVYSRDPITGLLTFVERELNGVGGVQGLGIPRSMVLSADGAWLYLADQGNAVLRFSRNTVTGSLTFLDASTEADPGVNGIAGTATVAISPDGANVYVTGSYDNGVATFSRDAGTGAITCLGANFAGLGLAQAGPLAVSGDGKNMYVVSGENALVVLARDTVTGMVTWVETQRDGGTVDGLRGAAAVAVSPDGSNVYVASSATAYTLFTQGDRAIAVFSRDAGTGALSFVEVLYDGVGGADGLGGANGIAVSPDGANVYVTSAGFGLPSDDDSVSVFARDPMTGSLAFVEKHTDGVGADTHPNSVAVSPDGANVYVGSQSFGSSDTLGVFARDGGTGALTAIQTLPLTRPIAVVVSPDGLNVYVATTTTGEVRTYDRDPLTGMLAFAGHVADEEMGANGLGYLRSLAISADGMHVYAPAFTDSAVAHLVRDPSDGALSFREAEFNGAGGVTGLLFASGVGVSPDGAHVYVAGSGSEAVTVFGFAGPVCPPTPTAICRGAGRSVFLVDDRVDDGKDFLLSRWVKGDQTLPGDFGDPVNGPVVYALCVYDDRGPGPTLIVDSNALNGGFCPTNDVCWRQLGTPTNPRGFSYRRLFGVPDGVTSLQLQSGIAGHAKVILKGKGDRLPLPGLPLVPPVTVQVVDSDGGCWGASYGAANVIRNGAPGTVFKARKP